jgi:hypothetical protein
MAHTWCMVSIFYRIMHNWSYANTIETLVLLVILYDIIWHRCNAIREIKRDKEAEVRLIQREQDLERRQIRRERQEVLRRHWQDLQGNLISLNRIASNLAQTKRFVAANNNSQDPTTQQVLATITNRIPTVMAELGDVWGRTVAQLNVFPQPRDILALEVLTITEQIGKSLGDSTVEIKDETLAALAELARRTSDPGTLPNLDD